LTVGEQPLLYSSKKEAIMKNKSVKPENQDFHISVGIQPTDDLNLDKEIRMVKAAILYADKVKLYSLKVPSILAISRFNNFPLNLQLEFFEKIIPFLSSRNNAQKLSASLKDYRKILQKEKLDIHELQLKNEFERKMEQNWKDIAEQTNKFVQESQINQINSAMKAGVLELHEFKNSDSDSGALDLMIENAAAASTLKIKGKGSKTKQDKAWIGEFVENISNSVSDDSTYPLLDNVTGNLVTAGVRSKISEVPSFGVDRGKQTELARYLLERLPLFEKASVDEILDIRKELDKPLARFRSAITNFSEDIKSTPWGKDFPPEADKIYIRDVKPALLDIEEAIQSNKFLTTLVRKFAEKPAALPKGSLFSIAISQFSSLPKELAASLGIGIASASLIYEAYDEWARKNQAIEKNKLYFYYGAGKRLNK
jgi:hypothetical protein